MPHITTVEAEEMLDKEYPVLDHGFVRLVDYMGGDSSITRAARVSYGAGTKTLSDDEALLDYMYRHQHSSPFEMVEFTFHCKMPLFVARQWIRHRTASVSELSGRYSVMKQEFYVPELSRLGVQSKTNKQGTAPTALDQDIGNNMIDILLRGQEASTLDYEDLISQDLARELARINLPLSTYTEWYWKIDLKNLLHFLALRLDSHAQWEIRQVANEMAEGLYRIAPNIFKEFI